MSHCGGRRIAQTLQGYSSEHWKRLAELGWLGLVIPDRYGGSGLGWEELVILLEETGRSLFPAPLISTALAASAILDSGDERQKERWLPRVADGSCIATLALLEASDIQTPDGIQLRGEAAGDGFVLHGEKSFVPDGGQAQLAHCRANLGSAEGLVLRNE